MGLPVWLFRSHQQFKVTDAKRLCQLVDADDCWVTSSALQTADVLLRKPGPFRDLFLGESLLPAYAGEVPANQAPHVHVELNGGGAPFSLSTIICIRILTKSARSASVLRTTGRSGRPEGNSGWAWLVSSHSGFWPDLPS